MFTLQNEDLRVDVLDPVNDAARLGPRFCWGGYIWQVHDAKVGPLLSGPQWPAADPSPFNGQGLPESFRHQTLDGRPLTWLGQHGVALGAGELRRDANQQVKVTRPCDWTVTTKHAQIEFTTRHEAAGFHYALNRRVALNRREVQSLTRLTNMSEREPLVLEWFAHPFFPLVDGLIRAEISVDANLPDNPGFSLGRGVLTQKRRFTGPDDGHMDRGLRLPPHEPLSAAIAHPAVGSVRFETSFAPDACVIWGNDRTFSVEPYLTLTLAPGAAREWHLLYRFGPSSGMSSPTTSSLRPVLR